MKCTKSEQQWHSNTKNAPNRQQQAMEIVHIFLFFHTKMRISLKKRFKNIRIKEINHIFAAT
jgi:hypothetical protein